MSKITIDSKDSQIRAMAKIGLMAAIICILGPLSIPIGPVPISFTNLAIYFALYLLGTKKGTISYLIYMLLGLVGLPVFSGFTGGPAKLLGPTGGYLIGFIFTALISGFFIDRFWRNYLLSAVGMILGIAVAYVFGTVWLAYSAGMTFSQALAAGVIPYVGFDLIKIVVLMLVGPEVRKALIRANLIAVCEKGVSQES